MQSMSLKTILNVKNVLRCLRGNVVCAPSMYVARIRAITIASWVCLNGVVRSFSQKSGHFDIVLLREDLRCGYECNLKETMPSSSCEETQVA